MLFVSLIGCATQSQDAFSLLPQEAQLIAFFDGAQLRRTKLWESLSNEYQDKPYLTEQFDPLRKMLGVDLVDDIETVSVTAWMSAELKPQYVGVLRLLPDKNIASLQKELLSSNTKVINGVACWGYEGVWLTGLNDREVLFGSEVGIERSLLVQKKTTGSVLDNSRLMELRAQVRPGQFYLVAEVPPLLSAGAAFFLSQAKVPGTEGLHNLAGLSSVVMSADFYSGVDIRLRAKVASEEAAEGLANQPLVQGLSGLGSLFFLRNMEDWLTSKAEDADWVVRVAVPGGQATELSRDILWFMVDQKQNRGLAPYQPLIPEESMPMQAPASLEALTP